MTGTSKKPIGSAETRWAVFSLGVGVAMFALQQVPDPADLLLINARIYPAGGSRGFYEALAVRGNRISAVGAAADTLSRLI